MKYVVTVRTDHHQELKKIVEEKLQELQNNEKNIVDISLEDETQNQCMIELY